MTLNTKPLRPIYLDLDGVFADFYGYARHLLGRPYRETPPAEAWAALDQVPNFFRLLGLLEEGRKLWEGLQAYRHYPMEVLTALPILTGELHSAAADKAAWVAENLSPELTVNTVSGGPQKVVFATPGAVLIDDLERNIRLWEQAGGIGILHRTAEETLLQLAQVCAESYSRGG